MITGTAIYVTSAGGKGGDGGGAHTGTPKAYGGAGGKGGDGGTAYASLGSAQITAKDGTAGVTVVSAGADGGAGGEAIADGGDAYGGDGTHQACNADGSDCHLVSGGDGGTASLVHGSATITVDTGTHGILVQSLGGQGGAGGKGEAIAGEAIGGNGGPGGNVGDVTVTSGGGVVTISMTSTTNSQNGIRVESIAGNGGKGGDGDGKTIDVSNGGDGGKGGNGGNVNAEIAANISTAGPSSNGIIARSYGGAGGDGGNATAPIGGGHGGTAAGAGPAGAVTLDFTGTITTAGKESNGILVQSIGGFAGNGGGATGFVSYGGGSQSAGDGGAVQVTLSSGTQIKTGGDYAYALQAQSVGGGGGRGGSAGGVAALGGSGSAGGNGGTVNVSTVSGVSLSTTGQYAIGLYATSNGGGGGDGGAATGVVSIGGQGRHWRQRRQGYGQPRRFD